MAALTDSPETLDMIVCLREMCSIFSTHPSMVPKAIFENLRHLDTTIVLSLVQARVDFNRNAGAEHWTKRLRYVI